VAVAKVEGEDAVTIVRELMGPTDPADAPPGTIRGDYGEVITENLVHGSDSPESAKRELDLFFG
jgi:nucleoside-diphosphate kinase